ncbi:MAG: hypothetical protein QM640_07250 [Niabella sp.]
MSIKSNEEYEKNRNRQVSGMRSVLDYAMGVLIIFIGIFLFFRFRLNIDLNKRFPPDIWDKVYGIIAIIYGGWRLYRGYKKNYFK